MYSLERGIVTLVVAFDAYVAIKIYGAVKYQLGLRDGKAIGREQLRNEMYREESI